MKRRGGEFETEHPCYQRISARTISKPLNGLSVIVFRSLKRGRIEITQFVLNVRKRDLSPTALHAIALETINTRFPPEEWLLIYTDGSLLDFAQGAGIGVFSHLFSFYLHAGPLTTHFDGNHLALQLLVLLVISLCKKYHGIPSSPRAAAVAKFRLLTGHDCLCAHLFRFNLVTSPICVLCDTGQDMTATHLDECSALNDLNCIVKRRIFLCLDNEHIFGSDQGYTPEIMDEILTTARYPELEVNEDDIEELIMGHEDELTIEDLQEILNDEHQETQRNVSAR
ncbi:uncharacterized protein TNCV_3586331 [Trichonephila clavipes]|nr:uncharacterized protein TNCV_3586331 [Trichonephila clavipes]